MSESTSGNISFARIDEEPIEEYGLGGYHPITLGDRFNDRYTILRKLGFGQYATVWLAHDDIEEKYVSIKVLKACESQKLGVTSEADILRKLLTLKGPSKHFVVAFLDHFTHAGPNGIHDCIVTEILGQSILGLCETGSVRLPFDVLKQVLLQLAIALDGLRRCGIVHTDLKQDNVLIYLPDIDSVIRKFLQDTTPQLIRTEGFPFVRMVSEKIPTQIADMNCLHVKLIDFGGANFINKQHSSHHAIQCNEFKAPEIILEAPWDCSTDIWNFACLAWEMASARSLFFRTAEDTDESRLAYMIEYCGPFPANVIAAGHKSHLYFDADGQFCGKTLPRKQLVHLVRLFLPDQPNHWVEFATFLMLALDLDKDKRLTAFELLELPFFVNAREESANPALAVQRTTLGGQIRNLLSLTTPWFRS